MNSRLFLMVVAVIAAFGIAAAVIGPVTMATPVFAQGNMTGGGMVGRPLVNIPFIFYFLFKKVLYFLTAFTQFIKYVIILVT
jgi:hypothetical protein